jgi:hypothetical protein
MIIDHADKVIGHFGQFKTASMYVSTTRGQTWQKTLLSFASHAMLVRFQRQAIRGLTAYCIPY